MPSKANLIRQLSLEELTQFLSSNDFPKFRAKQILDWIWKKNVGSFEEMKNIGKDLQSFLDRNFTLDKIVLKDQDLLGTLF